VAPFPEFESQFEIIDYKCGLRMNARGVQKLSSAVSESLDMQLSEWCLWQRPRSGTPIEKLAKEQKAAANPMGETLLGSGSPKTGTVSAFFRGS
jgi:hypothetical protein